MLNSPIRSQITDKLSPLPREIEIHDILRIAPADLDLVALDNDPWTSRALDELTGFLETAAGPLGGGPFRIELSAKSEPTSGYQAYRITPASGEKGLQLQGLQDEGVYWGMKTLKQLLCFEEGKIVVPLVTILDSADMEERGIWMQPFGPRTCAHSDLDLARDHYKKWMDFLSDHKMNLLEMVVIGENGGLQFRSTSHPELNSPDAEQRESLLKELFAYGRLRGLRMQPCITHPEHFNFVTEKHPELAGRNPTRHHTAEEKLPVNFFHPKTKTIWKDLAQEIVEVFSLPCLYFWLSENRLHALPPAEQTKSEFLQEAETYHAIAEEIGVKLKIALSQGSYPENLSLIHALPTEVKWVFYSGERYGTYNIRYRNPVQPDIAVATSEGHWISLCNSIRGVPGRPTAMAALHQHLGEAIQAGLKGVNGMSYAYPGDSMGQFFVAEHSWNWAGRTLDDTFRAFALVQEADDRVAQAQAYSLYDEVNRSQALHNTSGIGQPFGQFSRYFNMLERIRGNDKVDELVMHVADAIEDDEFGMLTNGIQKLEQALVLADREADELFFVRCRYLLHTLRATRAIARAFYINCREKSWDLTKGDWDDFHLELEGLLAEVEEAARQSAPLYEDLIHLEGWGPAYHIRPDPLTRTAEYAKTIDVNSVTSSRDMSYHSTGLSV